MRLFILEGELLITICLRFERTLFLNPDIAGLFISKFVDLHTDLCQVQTSDFLIQMLWKRINLILVVVGVNPKFQLSQNLISK